MQSDENENLRKQYLDFFKVVYYSKAKSNNFSTVNLEVTANITQENDGLTTCPNPETNKQSKNRFSTSLIQIRLQLFILNRTFHLKQPNPTILAKHETGKSH